MFNMGGGELALVALVALLILGPKKLPEVATTLGRWLRQLQKGFEEVKGSVKEGLREEETKDLTEKTKPGSPLSYEAESKEKLKSKKTDKNDGEKS